MRERMSSEFALEEKISKLFLSWKKIKLQCDYFVSDSIQKVLFLPQNEFIIMSFALERNQNKLCTKLCRLKIFPVSKVDVNTTAELFIICYLFSETARILLNSAIYSFPETERDLKPFFRWKSLNCSDIMLCKFYVNFIEKRSCLTWLRD